MTSVLQRERRPLAVGGLLDVVRPAMGIEPEGAYLNNQQASTQRIEAVVEAAIDAGPCVLIDWNAYDLHQEAAVAFFSA